MSDEKTSKFLSYVLRHKPDSIGLNLDSNGWAQVSELIDCAARAGTPIDLGTLTRIVRESDKQRFALSTDGQRIRANQGHSITVELALPNREPPEFLFHGTATRFLDDISGFGLQPKARHDVHLSENYETALAVGKRHGKVIVLKVLARKMYEAGHSFQCSANGVWLTKQVPPQFFTIESERL
ncbi:RNA 2'-phosphotransferase [Permianibacter sp. IMCC34836]|uniref:RNA 2'-phosphotransferase n=1 Tax=Permianibacter fluminis TaxID=2738515 RepID=UPI001557F90A|nr:RNA 2'-phosphotransferase [Permianibacter fluminis]NQD35993.1 RNA 2'-phosphotransferase [Permianibacter fluminis]